MKRREYQLIETSDYGKLPKGTLPDKVLFLTSRTSNFGELANFNGIDPKRLLKLKSNLVKFTKSPRLAGIAPVN